MHPIFVTFYTTQEFFELGLYLKTEKSNCKLLVISRDLMQQKIIYSKCTRRALAHLIDTPDF